MRVWQRILLGLSLLITGVAASPPVYTRAESVTLSPGDYAGRFYYSVDWDKVDKQTRGDFTTDLNYRGSIYIDGLVTLRVDKTGKIKPGVKISPNGTSAYQIHFMTVTPADCNVRAYLSADADSTIKYKSSGTSQSFITSLKLANLRTMHFEKKGSFNECPNFGSGSQAVLTGWINTHMQFVNKQQNLTFVVMKASKDALIGSILLDGLPVRANTPGGYTLTKDEGRFVLYKIDPLAPLDDDSLAPLVDDPLASLSEWRKK